jgi:hypothetical protein
MYPFVCNYCGLRFCPEHRLPEEHDCNRLPKKKSFWYQRQHQREQRHEEDRERRNLPLLQYDYKNLKPLTNKQIKKHPLAMTYIIAVVGFFLSLTFWGLYPLQALEYLTYAFELLGIIVFFYFLFRMMDRISLHSDMRLWGLRILAGIITLFGFLMFFTGIFEVFYLSIAFNQSLQIMVNITIIFFDFLGMGFMLLGSYLIFKFMRRSGIIIYHG